MSVVFRLNKISLVPKWQPGLSHLDQGPTGDVLPDKAMGYAVTALIRGDKDITLGYRLQGKLKAVMEIKENICIHTLLLPKDGSTGATPGQETVKKKGDLRYRSSF